MDDRVTQSIELLATAGLCYAPAASMTILAGPQVIWCFDGGTSCVAIANRKRGIEEEPGLFAKGPRRRRIELCGQLLQGEV